MEITRPYFEELERSRTTNIQVMGGVGSIALTDSHLEIFDSTQTLVPGTKIDLPQYRDGGSKRDLDVLVLTTDQAEVDAAEARARDIIGDELELSFFGLFDSKTLRNQASHPVKSSLRTFLADRYVTMEGDGIIGASKALYPFEVALDPALFETWNLMTDGIRIPVPHPGTVILNYTTRSISGLRPKDTQKVIGIANTVLSQDPEVKEWMHDGPGSGLLHFARVLHTLREPSDIPRALHVGDQLTIEPLSVEALRAASDTLLEGLSKRQKKIVLSVAKFKSRALHIPETNQQLVDFFQNHIEGHVGGIVRNK